MEIIVSRLPEEAAASEWEETVRNVVLEVGKLYGVEDAEVGVTLTDDAHIRDINRAWRGKDEATDVISFALNEGEEPIIVGGPPVNALGDLVVSLERAAEQAEEYGHSLKREIAFLTAHGMLHLLGYDHIEEKDREKMRREEERILSALHIARQEAE